MQVCQNCGATVPEQARVCPVCTHPVSKQPEVRQPATAAPTYGAGAPGAVPPPGSAQPMDPFSQTQAGSDPQTGAGPQADSGSQAGAPWGQPSYVPPPGYQPPAPWGQPVQGFPGGAAAAPHNDGLAVASMVCGIVGLIFCPFIVSVAGIIMGAISHGRITRSGGALQGSGMAKAGIILGIVSIVLWAIVVFGIIFGVFNSGITHSSIQPGPFNNF